MKLCPEYLARMQRARELYFCAVIVLRVEIAEIKMTKTASQAVRDVMIRIEDEGATRYSIH